MWRHNNHYDDGTKKGKTQEVNTTKTAGEMTSVQIESNLSEQQKFSHFLLLRSCTFLRKEFCFSIFLLPNGKNVIIMDLNQLK